MAVFDVTQKDQVREIYSLGETSGGMLNFCYSVFELR